MADLLNGHAGDHERVERVVAAVRSSAAIPEALDEAKAYVARAQAALAATPNNEYRRGLTDLAEYLVSRNL
jgi:geranylgeranyl pyrophosphate synthase